MENGDLRGVASADRLDCMCVKQSGKVMKGDIVRFRVSGFVDFGF